MGFTDDFETSLQVLRGFSSDITTEVNEIKRSVASTSKGATIQFYELKRKRYWYPLMIGIGLLVLQQLSGINGVLFYSSNIFASAGVSSSNAATFGLGAIQVIATGVTTWLVDKAGRRVLLIDDRKTGLSVGYKGCQFHRVIKDFMIQAGDFLKLILRGGFLPSYNTSRERNALQLRGGSLSKFIIKAMCCIVISEN